MLKKLSSGQKQEIFVTRRVDEITKELKNAGVELDNKDVVTELQSLGYDVKSFSSSLDDDQANTAIQKIVNKRKPKTASPLVPRRPAPAAHRRPAVTVPLALNAARGFVVRRKPALEDKLSRGNEEIAKAAEAFAAIKRRRPVSEAEFWVLAAARGVPKRMENENRFKELVATRYADNGELVSLTVPPGAVEKFRKHPRAWWHECRRILVMSHADFGRLMGVGERQSYRYECGDAVPSGIVQRMLDLLLAALIRGERVDLDAAARLRADREQGAGGDLIEMQLAMGRSWDVVAQVLFRVLTTIIDKDLLSAESLKTLRDAVPPPSKEERKHMVADHVAQLNRVAWPLLGRLYVQEDGNQPKGGRNAPSSTP